MKNSATPSEHPGNPAPLLRLCDAALLFGSSIALNGIDLHVSRGERLAIVGSNGSGKSSLLRLMHGLVKPTSGRVIANGSSRQAMLFQRPYMLRASVLMNVALGAALQGASFKSARLAAMRSLQSVGLLELAMQNAKTLSGGQQQRLALARSLALNPDVLFLDEPTSSLDPHTKREVEELLIDLDANTTLVFASHNLGQVKRLATRVVYLEHGTVGADMPVAAFFNSPYLKDHHPSAFLFTQGEFV